MVSKRTLTALLQSEAHSCWFLWIAKNVVSSYGLLWWITEITLSLTLPVAQLLPPNCTRISVPSPMILDILSPILLELAISFFLESRFTFLFFFFLERVLPFFSSLCGSELCLPLVKMVLVVLSIYSYRMSSFPLVSLGRLSWFI